MKKLINTKTAGNILLALFGLLVAFHIIILFNLLPSNVVWGGQVGGSQSGLRTLETISLVFTILFSFVVAAKMGYVQVGKFSRVINILLWIIFAYLPLNAVGNLVSSSSLETLLFTPITIMAALLVFRLAIEHNVTNSPTRM